jgi:hypothetical protein
VVVGCSTGGCHEGRRVRGAVRPDGPTAPALIAYEANGALDVAEPQRSIDDVRRATPVVRWELGLEFFRMDDVVVAGRNPLTSIAVRLPR